jgi:phytoene dehydrogenase-like protein
MKTLLQSAAVLQQIGKRLAEHQSLLDRVRQQLPSDLASHCLAVVPDGDRITLYTDSPAWASRLRYLAAELESQLRSGKQTVRQVRVRVLAVTFDALATPSPRKAKRLSAENRRMLLNVAEGLSEPSLRAALRRLATTGGGPGDDHPTDSGRM